MFQFQMGMEFAGITPVVDDVVTLAQVLLIS